jgi:hypothetical protein
VDEDGAGGLEPDFDTLAVAAEAYVESSVRCWAESGAKADPWALKEVRVFPFPLASILRQDVILLHVWVKP